MIVLNGVNNCEFFCIRWNSIQKNLCFTIFAFAEDLHPSSGVEFVPFLLRITECNGIKIISLCIRKKSAIQLYSIRGLNPFRGWRKINCKDCKKISMHGGQEYFYFSFIGPNNTEDFCQKELKWITIKNRCSWLYLACRIVHLLNLLWHWPFLTDMIDLSLRRQRG